MQWVLREMSRQVSQWRADISMPPDFFISMNVPINYLKQCYLNHDIDAFVINNYLIPQSIRFDLSETDIQGNE